MLELYDCTLREGEQMSGVSFSLLDRLKLVKALDDFGVDYIELGWPIASPEILESFHKVLELNLKSSKIVAFGSTSIAENAEEDENLKSLVKSKAEYACIFGKSWIPHVEIQLKITPEENLKKIFNSISFLISKGIKVFYDAEHYFDGFKDHKEYALATIKTAADAGALKLILCDTRGGMLPDDVKKIIRETKEFLENNKINLPLGVHFHQDSGLALANALVSLPYINQIQATVNGFGERIGNLDLCELVPTLAFKKNTSLKVDLNKLKELSELFYEVTNLPTQIRQPYVSNRAFTHKGGIHIDAEKKGASYQHISPEMLGLNNLFLLNSIGGSSGVVAVAEKFGFNLDKKVLETKEKISQILKELAELEKKGYDIGHIEAEQFLLLEKHLGNLKKYFTIKKWNIKTDHKGSTCELIGNVNGSSSK